MLLTKLIQENCIFGLFIMYLNGQLLPEKISSKLNMVIHVHAHVGGEHELCMCMYKEWLSIHE